MLDINVRRTRSPTIDRIITSCPNPTRLPKDPPNTVVAHWTFPFWDIRPRRPKSSNRSCAPAVRDTRLWYPSLPATLHPPGLPHDYRFVLTGTWKPIEPSFPSPPPPVGNHASSSLSRPSSLLPPRILSSSPGLLPSRVKPSSTPISYSSSKRRKSHPCPIFAFSSLLSSPGAEPYKPPPRSTLNPHTLTYLP